MKKLLSTAVVLSALSFSSVAQEPLKTDNTWFCDNYNEIETSFGVFMLENEKRREHYFKKLYENSTCIVWKDDLEYYVIDSSFAPLLKIEVWYDGEPYIGWGFAPSLYDDFELDLTEWGFE